MLRDARPAALLSMRIKTLSLVLRRPAKPAVSKDEAGNVSL
jgi:hypothetical protein